mgnify:CR=1 FL=1
MALTVNGAGLSAADPFLNGLELDLVASPDSMDVAVVNDVFLDTASGFPGSTTVRSSLTPAATVLTAGSAASYASGELNIGNNTGLSTGDYLYVSHGTISDGLYKIATLVSSDRVTLENDPFAGTQSNISFQVAWAYRTSALNSSAGGTENHFKADLEDAGGNNTQAEDSIFVRDAPSGADYVELEGGTFTGTTANDGALTLQILRSWTNNGGVSNVELANHSGQGVNNFTWQSGGGAGEVALATAEAGLNASGGDGAKYGRLLLKAATGGLAVGVDFDITIDSAGPTVSLAAFGS